MKNHDQMVDGHNGGYYYGTTVQPKDFKLRCYFEDTFVNSGVAMRAEGLFRKGRTGKLVFKNRPWCYYTATVMNNVQFSDLKSYLNGVVTIELRAYYPFALSDQLDILTYSSYIDPNEEDVLNNTGMFYHRQIAENRVMGHKYSFDHITSRNTVYYLYNAGTEMADMIIRISGSVGEGLEMTNETTGQKFTVYGTTLRSMMQQGERLAVDSMNGKCDLVSTDDNSYIRPGYVHHDGGFIQLAPCTPFIRSHAAVRASTIYGTQGDENADNTKGVVFVDENGQPKPNLLSDDYANGSYYLIGTKPDTS